MRFGAPISNTTDEGAATDSTRKQVNRGDIHQAGMWWNLSQGHLHMY